MEILDLLGHLDDLEALIVFMFNLAMTFVAVTTIAPAVRVLLTAGAELIARTVAEGANHRAHRRAVSR